MSTITDIQTGIFFYTNSEKRGEGVQYDPSAIGRTIRRLRLRAGMSQDALSGLAGIARTHLSMIENGEKQPNFETIWKIAAALEMRASDLIVEIEHDCSD